MPYGEDRQVSPTVAGYGQGDALSPTEARWRQSAQGAVSELTDEEKDQLRRYKEPVPGVTYYPGKEPTVDNALVIPGEAADAFNRRKGAINKFSAKMVNKFDAAQEADYLKWVASNSVDANTAAEVRRLLILKPELDFDYAARNLRKLQQDLEIDKQPWEAIAVHHPVLAQYLKDPATARLVTQDSAQLRGIDRIFGSGPTSAVAPWQQALADTFKYKLPHMLVGLGILATDAATSVSEAVGDEEGLKVLADKRKYLTQAYASLGRELPSTKNYSGEPILSNDTPTFSSERMRIDVLARGLEHGVTFAAENIDLMLGAAAGARVAVAKGGAAAVEGALATNARAAGGRIIANAEVAALGQAAAEKAVQQLAHRGMFYVNTAFSVADLYPRLKAETGSTGAALAGTAVGAPFLGKVMGFTPMNTALGHGASDFLIKGLDRVAARALESNSYRSLLWTFAKKVPLDVLSGQTSMAFLGASNAMIDQMAGVYAGKDFDFDAVTKAGYDSFVDMRPALLAVHGSGMEIYRAVGRMQRARAMAKTIDALVEHLQKSSTAATDPDLHEQLVKEMAAASGTVEPFFHLPIDRFDEVLSQQGFNPREVAAEIYGDGGKAYDAAKDGGAHTVAIPVEKMHRVINSKWGLGDLAVNEGTLNTEVLSRVAAIKVTEEFQAAIEETLKRNPEEFTVEEKAIYDALTSFAGSDATVAQEMLARVIALSRTNPHLTMQDVFEGMWGEYGIFGPGQLTDPSKVTLTPGATTYGGVVRGPVATDAQGRPYDINIRHSDAPYRLSAHLITVDGQQYYGGISWLGDTLKQAEILAATKTPENPEGKTFSSEDWANMARGTGAATSAYLHLLRYAQQHGVGVAADATWIPDSRKGHADGPTPSARMYLRLKEAGVPFEDFDPLTNEGRTKDGDILPITKISAEALAKVDLDAVERKLIQKVRDNGGTITLFPTFEIPPAVDRALTYAIQQTGLDLEAQIEEKLPGPADRTEARRKLGELTAAAKRDMLERLKVALTAKIPTQLAAERAKLERQYTEEIKSDPGQRARHFYESPAGELWNDEGGMRSLLVQPPVTQSNPHQAAFDAANAKLEGLQDKAKNDPAFKEARRLAEAAEAHTNVVLEAQTVRLEEAQARLNEVLAERQQTGEPTPDMSIKDEASRKAKLTADKRKWNGLQRRVKTAGEKLEEARTLHAVAKLENEEAWAKAAAHPRYQEALDHSSALKAASAELDAVAEKYWDIETELVALKDRVGRAIPFDPDEIDRLMGPGTAAKLRLVVPGAVATPKTPGPRMDIDAAASHLGFPGSQGDFNRDGARGLINSLLYSLPEKKAIKELVDVRLTESLRSPLLDHPQGLLTEVLDTVHTPKAVASVISRFRRMGQQLDPARQAKSAMTPELWEARASKLIMEKSLAGMKPEDFVRAAREAALRTLDALEKGQMDRAFDATEAQILNHYLYRKAREMQGSVTAMQNKLVERATSDRWRAALGKADTHAPDGRPHQQIYRDFHDSLMESIGLGEPRPAGAPVITSRQLIERVTLHGQEPLLAIAPMEEGSLNNGKWDPEVVDALLTKTKKWGDLTPAEAMQAFNAIINLQHIAKKQVEALKAARSTTVEETLNMVERHMKGGTGVYGPDEAPGPLPESPHPIYQERRQAPHRPIADSLVGKLVRAVTMDAVNESARLILKKMGLKDTVWQGYLDAKSTHADLLHKLYVPWRETQRVFESDPNFHAGVEEITGKLRMPDAAGLPMDGMLSRAYLAQVVKWVGSESGRAKALKALNVPVDTVLDLAGKYLTKEQMDAIQAEHDLFDALLYPQMAAAHERRTGLPLEKVQALGYTIKFADGRTGVYRGGYYPIHWDGRPGVEKTARPVNIEGSGQMYPQVPNGSFIERTAFVGVPDFNWDNIPSHFLSNIHNLAYGDFVMDTNRILLNPRMGALVVRHLGPDYGPWARHWMERVARGSSGSIASHLSDLGDGLRQARSGSVVAMIGFNFPILLAHMPHALGVAAMRDGHVMSVTHAAPSMLRVLQSMAAGVETGYDALWEENRAKSRVLQLRADTIREDMEVFYKGFVQDGTVSESGDWQPATKVGKLGAAYRQAGLWHLRLMDRMMSNMIWDAKYRYVLEKTGDEQAAIKEADDQVSASMPSYSPMEMPSLLSEKSNIAAMMLVFHTFWAKYRDLYNEGKYDMRTYPALQAQFKGQTKDATALWREPTVAGAKQGARSLEFSVRALALLTYGIVVGEFLKGQGKQADEDWEEWFVRRELGAPLKMIPYATAFLEPTVDALVHQRGKMKNAKPEITNAFFAPVERGVQFIAQFQDPAKTNFDHLENFLESATMMSGYPSVAPFRTARYATDVATGAIEPRGPFDLMGGLIYGEKRGRGRRYMTKNPAVLMQDWVESISK